MLFAMGLLQQFTEIARSLLVPHEVLKSVAGDKAASAIEKRLFAPGRAADCSPWSGDTLAILLACRHGPRAPELVTGRSEVGANRLIDFKSATLHVRRVKNGTPASPKAGSRAFGGIRPGMVPPVMWLEFGVARSRVT